MNRIFITMAIFGALATTALPQALSPVLDGNSGGYGFNETTPVIAVHEIHKPSCFTRTWDGFNGNTTQDCL